MASSGAVSVPLEPQTTASLQTVEQNADSHSYHFFKLSLELRLIIYEYVLPLDDPISPRQVTKKSNKFVWGKHSVRHVNDHMGNQIAMLVSEEPPLMFTQLVKTCHQIYSDLTAYPVFYRVNSFEFEQPDNAHKFLAALTPQRRHMIRSISLWRCDQDADDTHWSRSQLGLKPQGLINKHTIVLLRDCEDLRSLNLCVGHFDYLKRVTERHFGPILNGIIRNAASIPNARSFWRFPCLGVTVRAGGDFPNRFVRFDVDGKSSYPSIPSNLRDFSDKPEIRQLFDLANNAMAEHRKRLKDQGDDEGPTREELHRAIEAANIDFPGDIRTMQMRSTGLNDVISRRTRAQVKAESQVTDWGTIRQDTPKYNSEGILLWDYYRLLYGIRWNGPLIEVQVRFLNRAPPADYSWEELHHIANWVGFHRIRVYLSRILSRWSDPKERLEMIENMPSPEDIESAFEGFLDDEDPKDYIDNWVGVKELYPTAINTLKREAKEKEEEQEAKRAAAAAREEAKAAKQLEKLANKSARASNTCDGSTKKGSIASQSGSKL
ncbi:hypothetical protein F5X99DRAFT_426984 [Biscogniauxia marginata]|nr:hypothetical protein F5X99DRAFT_426984 [Biscogniauxia marginata]